MHRANDDPSPHPELIDAMEQLARRERDSAPPGLEDRVFLRTQAAILAGNHGSPVVKSGMRLKSLSRLAAAAAVLIGVGVIAVLFSRSPNAPSVQASGYELAVSLERDIDGLLSLGSLWSDETTEQIDLLFAQSAVLDSQLATDWYESDLFLLEDSL